MRREPPRGGRTTRLRALCTTIPDDRGDESFADDLNMGRGIVSGRVALLLRSTEIPPHRPKDFPQENPSPKNISYLPKISALRAAKGAGVQGREGRERGQTEGRDLVDFRPTNTWSILAPPRLASERSERAGAPAGGPKRANYRNFRSPYGFLGAQKNPPKAPPI